MWGTIFIDSRQAGKADSFEDGFELSGVVHGEIIPTEGHSQQSLPITLSHQLLCILHLCTSISILSERKTITT